MGRSQQLVGAEEYYSRRITDEHRLVYKIDGGDVLITSCRYHHEAQARLALSDRSTPSLVMVTAMNADTAR